MSSDFLPHYSRLAPGIAHQAERPVAKATRVQSAIEYSLFAVFGVMLVIAAIALIVTNSASHKRVPNRVAAGIEADRVNIMLIETTPNRKTNVPTAHALFVLSVKPSSGETALTSISRDLWVRLGNYGTRRLSAALAVGRATGYPGEDAGLTSDTVSQVIGEPVHAFVRLEIGQFISAIDAVGGITIDVEKPLYEHRSRQRFTRGRHHFDGRTAFRYASSPNVMGPAGDRFAREARQQQVVSALLAKMSRPEFAEQLAHSLTGKTTNLTKEQVAWLSKTVGGREPRTLTLAPYLEEVRIATLTYKGEVVRPRDGDYRAVQHVVENVFAPAAVAR